MAPLLQTGLGWILVLLDVRLNGFDVFIDFIGWLLIAYSVGRIAWRSSWFEVTRVVAIVAAVLSLRNFWTTLADSRVLDVVEGFVLTAAVVVLGQAMYEAVVDTPADARSLPKQLRVIQAATLVLWALTLIGFAVRLADEHTGDILVAIGTAFGTLVLVWFAVLQLFSAERDSLGEYKR